MTGKNIVRNVAPRVPIVRPPLRDYDERVRAEAATEGSRKLALAVVALVERTASRIAVPAEWQHRPIDFAASYLGIEVCDEDQGLASGN